MTLFDLATSIRRFWWLAATGLVLTAAVAVHVAREPGVYWAQVNVVLLAPAFPTSPNALSQTPTRVIELASVIQRAVAGVEGPHVVSDGVTIVDEGVRSGEAIRLPNAGGQWANNFNRPYVEVEVVDETREAATARLTQVLARVDRELETRQTIAGVASENRVTTQLSPSSPQISYTAGSPGRGVVATGVVGALLTFGAVLLVDARMVGLDAATKRRRGRGREGGRHAGPVLTRSERRRSRRWTSPRPETGSSV